MRGGRVEHEDFTEWRGKEGLLGRHATFVPLRGLTIGPNSLQVNVPKELVRTAPNIELHGGDLSPTDELVLYGHFQLPSTHPISDGGRRLVRR